MSRTRDLRQFQPSPSPSPGKSKPTTFDAENPKDNLARPPRPPAFSTSEDPLYQSRPPSRPQRSAARQPGIVVNNVPTETYQPTERRYRSPSPSEQRSQLDRRGGERQGPDYSPRHVAPPRSDGGPRDRHGNNHKLYQAVSSRKNEGNAPPPLNPSRPTPNSNGLLKEDYRSRRDLDPRPPDDDHRPHIDNRLSRTSSDGSYDPERNADLLTANDLKGVRQNHGVRNVLKVFAESVARPDAKRRPTQPHASSSSTDVGRHRRPAVAEQGFHAKPSRLDDQSYPMTPGFREIEQVLQRIKSVWERTGITGSGEADESEDSEQRSSHHFSPVGLALDLLESEGTDKAQSAKRVKEMINQKGGLVPSLSSFLKLKADLEKALQVTIQTNYRQFDASVNAYNSARVNVENSCKQVAELKNRLSECRNVLGSGGRSNLTGTTAGGKGTEMKALQGRREMLGEMLKLIDMIDQLKQVPERLETLISSKNFLSATVLLVRSLKLINKPELVEIGGLVDLRSYFVNQETVLFEILIEELHNHLYLKSYFCDNRWRVYRKGQDELPIIRSIDASTVDAEAFNIGNHSTSNTPATSHIVAFAPVTSMASQRKTGSHAAPSLQHFLNDIMTKPQSNPLLDEPDLFLEIDTSGPSSDSPDNASSSPVTHKLLSFQTLDSKKRKQPNVNPETNSFVYIESLIESLAVLGKLSLGLDGVLQRAPLEIYNLVEATLHEVDERHDSTHVSTSVTKTTGQGSGIMNAFTSNGASTLSRNFVLSSNTNISQSHRASALQINMNEVKELESVSEILQDFFWTLFSKLDATLQSFRVLHEVSSRISERKGFKEDGMKSSNVLFSLLEVWKPIQSEVRALIHDYLTDLGDTGFGGGDGISRSNQPSMAATAARRNPIVSIAEVLKINISGSSTTSTNISAIWKDSNKQLFKFKDTDLKSNNKDLKHHEANLDFALKVSVPGLVLDSTTVTNNTGGGILLTTGLLNDEAGTNRTGGSHGNGTHRLLVKPDAFYITLLLKPTLEFLMRAKDVLPSGVVVSTTEERRISDTRDRREVAAGDDVDRAELVDDMGTADARMSLTQFDGFNGFLDDFVLHTFLPQLEEKVITVFEHAISAPDAFQDGHRSAEANALERGGDVMGKKLSSHLRMAKSMTTLITLIDGLCDLLQTMPFHREKYGRLIVSVVVQYYQKCHERFKELVSREQIEATEGEEELGPHASLKLAADWAQRSELSQCLNDVSGLSSDPKGLRKLWKRQSQIEQQFLERHEVDFNDLIQSPKKISALCNLYSSLDCFVTFTRTLSSAIQIVPPSDGDGPVEESAQHVSSLQPFSPLSDPHQQSGFRMPLTQGLLSRFQLAQTSYQSLAQIILFTLHIELRLQAYHFIRKTCREGQYFLTPSDSTDPDPNIIELNSLILGTEAALSSTISAPQRHLVLSGFGHFLNRLLINSVLSLKIGNEYGFRKMYRNVLALQQNMKTMRRDDEDQLPELASSNGSLMYSDFERSRKFWELAASGPDAVMSSIRNGASYSFEQYRHLLCLLCMINPQTTGDNVLPAELGSLEEATWAQTNTPNSPGFDKRKRIYNESLIELHALVLDDEDDDDES